MLVERILGIGGGIVAHDRDAADAVLRELGHVADDLGDHRLHVRAVVADEHHDGAVGAADRVQRVAPAVGPGQIERVRHASPSSPAGVVRLTMISRDGKDGYVRILAPHSPASDARHPPLRSRRLPRRGGADARARRGVRQLLHGWAHMMKRAPPARASASTSRPARGDARLRRRDPARRRPGAHRRKRRRRGDGVRRRSRARLAGAAGRGRRAGGCEAFARAVARADRARRTGCASACASMR